MADGGPFKRRSGGTGGTDQAPAIAHDQFAVGAHIDNKGNQILVMRDFGDQNRRSVRPDKAGHDRQQKDAGPRADPEPDFCSPDAY